jgi:hypothetical protein
MLGEWNPRADELGGASTLRDVLDGSGFGGLGSDLLPGAVDATPS